MECKDNWLKKGCTGPNVGRLQELINKTKLFTLAVDNNFGPITESVLKKIQDLLWITIDGIAGDQTTGQLKNFIVGLVKIGYYLPDRQDNAYQCGPSAARMGLSILGYNILESWLAKKAGTNKNNGTSVSGLVLAITEVNKEFGASIKPTTSGKIPLATLAQYIKNKIPVLVRLRSWINPNGGQHWVLITAINLNNQTIRFADPSAGERVTTLADFKNRVQYVIDRNIPQPFIILR